MEKIRVGIVGATGMVGQRFITLLQNHPWFEITALAASARSAGQTYGKAIEGRKLIADEMADWVLNMQVDDAADVEKVAAKVDMVFCAVNMKKDEILALEEAYAKADVPVVSNNSANRHTPDVPMMLPELNWAHMDVIPAQRKRLGVEHGFIAVKPNCSLQSYVPALYPLHEKYGVKKVVVTTLQAISGAGKTFDTMPEIIDNVIPYIGGEEAKSEVEPLKIFGKVENGVIAPATEPVISAQCMRVAVSDGHLATVAVEFENKPTREEILDAWKAFSGEPQTRKLPSAPTPFITYFEEDNRPQTNLDRNVGNGMGIAIGRLREDNIFQYKFVCLSHNTLRGAAGGAVLTAESLVSQGYITRK